MAAKTWFVPIPQPPFVIEEHSPNGPPVDLRVLEISSRSDVPLGRQLSAMYLIDPDTGKPVESAYQAAKCYGADGGPAELLDNGFASKSRDRERARQGGLRGFEHQGTFWPAETGTQFYDRLWIRAARNAGVEKVEYGGFSDMFHQRGRAYACQARSMAMMQGMIEARKLDRIEDPVGFAELMDEMYATERTDEGRRDEVRVAVTGSQRFRDRDVIFRKLDEVRSRVGAHPMRVMHSGEGALDAEVQAWAQGAGVVCETWSADWDAHPKNAGYVRNEQLVGEGDPHLLIAFPDYDAKTPRHLGEVARETHVTVEHVHVDGTEAWTETESGELVDLERLAEELERTQPVDRVSGPGPLAAARIANGDPKRDGEIRIVVAPGPNKENEDVVNAKLDSLRERAAPAAVRVAIEETIARDDAPAIALRWARRNQIRCDVYLKQQGGDSDEQRLERMITEQQPHLVLTGRATSAAMHERAAAHQVPVETTTATGWTRTSDGKLTDLAGEEARFRGHADPTAPVIKTHPGQSAREARKRLGMKAADAAWAEKGRFAEQSRALNLRDQDTRDAIRNGAAVRIDRRTEWGNPIPLRRGADDAERAAAVEDFRETLVARIDSGQVDIERLASIAGKPVGCHCAPKLCHGDVLTQAADWAADRERERIAEQERRQPAPRDNLVEDSPDYEAVVLDDLPPWDDTKDLEPEEAVEQHAWQPGVSQVEALNRRREQLIFATRGLDAADEMIERFDNAVWEFEIALAETPADDRLERLRAEHPDAARVETAAAHIDKVREAGASEKQIEAMQEAVAETRARIERDAQRQVADRNEERRDVAYLLEKMNAPEGPLAVASELMKQAREARGDERSRRDRGRTQLRPPAPAPETTVDGRREVRVMVCGSRNFDEPNLLRAKLDEVRQRIGSAPMRVVTGDSRGSDRDALQWCRDAGVPCDVYEADWSKGPSAGYARNDRMLQAGSAHVLVAFPRDADTPLTEHLIMKMNEADLPVEIVDESGMTRINSDTPANLDEIGRRADDPEQPTSKRDEASENPEEELARMSPIQYAARISSARELGSFDDLETMQAEGPAAAPSAAADTPKETPADASPSQARG